MEGLDPQEVRLVYENLYHLDVIIPTRTSHKKQINPGKPATARPLRTLH